MHTQIPKNLSRIMLGAVILATGVSEARAQTHPICQTTVAGGVTLQMSAEEIQNKWKAAGLQDITCKQRMKMTCEQRRKTGVIFATNPSGFLEKLNDKKYTLNLNPEDGSPRGILARTRTNAPETLQAHDENRSWDGWGHKDWIETNINKYCKQPTPENVRISCKYGSALDIELHVGDPRNKECNYKFSARYRAPYGPTPADHAIIEQITLF